MPRPFPLSGPRAYQDGGDTIMCCDPRGASLIWFGSQSHRFAHQKENAIEASRASKAEVPALPLTASGFVSMAIQLRKEYPITTDSAPPNCNTCPHPLQEVSLRRSECLSQRIMMGLDHRILAAHVYLYPTGIHEDGDKVGTLAHRSENNAKVFTRENKR